MTFNMDELSELEKRILFTLYDAPDPCTCVQAQERTGSHYRLLDVMRTLHRLFEMGLVHHVVSPSRVSYYTLRRQTRAYVKAYRKREEESVTSANAISDDTAPLAD